jgi:crotonobetainyl-CoA:carnitine CoA-transferase CaiB-like acyl-CoA transferase
VRPLDGTRVLDVTGALGAYCTKLLAGLGADVVKVEPPGGDELRRRPPFRDGVDGDDASLVFSYYHAGKRGITLDTQRRESVALLGELAATADVVVASPTRRRPLAGFDDERLELTWARTDAIVCVMTPYGLTGPHRHWRATHFVAYAATGLMHKIGPPEGPPVVIPGQQHWDDAGTHAAVSILAALRNRADVGGQTIDISALEVAATRDFAVDRYDVEGMAFDRSVTIGYPPTGTWQCADGPFDVAAHQTRHWDAFLDMLDHPDVLSDPSLQDVLVRREIFDGLQDSISELLASRNRADLLERGQAAGLPCAVLSTPAEFVADEQLAARGYFVTVSSDEVGGEVRMPGAAFMSSPALFAVTRAAPALGEHNREVFVDELGHTIDELAEWRDGGLV